MSMKRFLCIAVLFYVFGANELRAQGALGFPEWLQVGNDIGPGWTAIYFIDPIHGVTALGGSIYYTTIGLWNLSSTPAGMGSIRSIRSIQGKLYAASQGTDVVVSTDSGQSWQFSGLHLIDANDVYADGSGNIRILTDPMTSFARIDTMHCVAVGGGSLFVSSDGGLNWTTSVTGIDPSSIGSFADPCYHVFICPSTWGTAALRSTDSGQTWQDVLTGAGPYPEYIEGASTTCYLNDNGGMFRSIDDGVTWTSIITVNGGPHFPMYVWGPMGEQAALSEAGSRGAEIEMTTTGGDDNLHSAVEMTDSNGAPLMQEDTMNVPFHVVSTCNSFLIPIALEADVPGLSVKAALTDAGGGDFSLQSADSMFFSEPVLNERYSQDTIWLAYDPHHAVDTALITFENHWNCSDWFETRSVIITALPKAEILPPPLFVGNCKPVSEAAFVLLDSCQELIVDSLGIPGTISSRLYPAKPLPDTLRLGMEDSLFFTFNPADTVASQFDSIQIFGHFYPSPGLDSTLNYFNYNAYWEGYDSDFSYFEQSILVHLIALPGVALFSFDSAIALQRTSLCEQTIDTTVTFTNEGCATDTIVQIVMTGSGYSVTPTSLPILVPPDSSTTVVLNFEGTDTGLVPGALTLTAVSNETRMISIPVTGIGFPHTGILSMPTRSIDAGGFSICSGDTVVMDTLSNTGCDTLAITDLTIAGDSDFTIVGPNSGLLIPPDSTLIVTIHFKPLAKGPRKASVSFHSANSSGIGPSVDTAFTLSGTGLHGTMILAAHAAPFDAGTTYVCQEVDTFLVLQDIGCDTVNIAGVSLSSSGFSIAGGGGSMTLAPGAYDTIWLTTQIDTTGGTPVNIDSLFVTSDANPPIPPIVLTREIAYPTQWRLYPSSPDSATAGTDVTFKILQSGTLPPDVSALDFTLTYNDDLLRFLRVDEPSVDSLGYYRTPDGLAHLTFQVSPIGIDSVVATLHFYPYVAASLQTDLLLDSVHFVSSLGRSTDCIAAIVTGQSEFTLEPECGSDELSNFLLNGTILITAIDPDPALGTIVVGIASGVHAATSTELSIIDGLGRTVLQQNIVLAGGGETQFQMNIENLPSGIYAVQLRAAGLASTREFIKK
jgi:hypothetical protein